jgi:FF domain-containing protein
VQPALPSPGPDPAPSFPVILSGIDKLNPYSAGKSTSTDQYWQHRGEFRGGRDHRDGRRRQREDRPKSKHAIPSCDPWLLVKTRLGRRFVHNPETNESFWKFPQDVLKGVVELDRLEREKKERNEQGDEIEGQEEKGKQVSTARGKSPTAATEPRTVEIRGNTEKAADESDEYEEVEVTDEEDEPSTKRPRAEGKDTEDRPLEFNEDDIAYQLTVMGEEYGLDPGEYGEVDDLEWEQGLQGLPLTEEETAALFRDLLDDYQVNPYTPWEKIIEEGRIIEDNRYTVLSNMKLRREVWSTWSRDRIRELKERREKQEEEDPRIGYLSFLQERATPKLYWPEFKRKFRKEPKMKHPKISDKDCERYYRDHVARLKLPESTKKSDLFALLNSIPLPLLNRSCNVEALPPAILIDLRYITLPPKVRDPLIEAYISTLPLAPEQVDLSVEEQEARERKRLEREKRERALTEREKHVQEEKQRQKDDLMRGRNRLRQGEAEIEHAMRVGKEGLKGYMEAEQVDQLKEAGENTS